MRTLLLAVMLVLACGAPEGACTDALYPNEAPAGLCCDAAWQWCLTADGGRVAAP